MLNRISENVHVNNDDINAVISTIETLFTSSAQLTFGPKYKHDNNKADNTKKKRWFNAECFEARNTFHKVRKLYNKYKTAHYNNLLKNISKEYKMKMNRSFEKFQNENICKLCHLKSAKPREFWKIINSLDNTNRKTCLTFSRILMPKIRMSLKLLIIVILQTISMKI